MKKLITNNYYFLLILVVSGCVTSPTGKRKFLGVIPAGRTDPVIKDEKLLILADQLEIFLWVGIPLVIFGVYWWFITKGFTGLGKLSIGLGSVFIATAILIPQVPRWVLIIPVIAVVVVGIYFVVDWLRKK